MGRMLRWTFDSDSVMDISPLLRHRSVRLASTPFSLIHQNIHFDSKFRIRNPNLKSDIRVRTGSGGRVTLTGSRVSDALRLSDAPPDPVGFGIALSF